MHKNQGRFFGLLAVATLAAIFGFNAYAQSASTAGGTAPAQPAAQPNSPVADKAVPEKPADVSVNVNVVNALVSVRDKHGALVKNLGKDDFVLTADGSPQIIHYFAEESNLPLTLGLLIDTSVSQRNVLDDERTASYKFLDQMLHQEKDVAFVIHFDHEIELLQDVTSSRAKLEEALHSLQIEQPSNNDDDSDSHSPQGVGTGNQQPHMHHHGGADLYDAVYLASNEVMKDQHGRKALVVLTDGVDRGSKETMASAVEAAERADTMVYSIYFKSDEEADNQSGGFGRHHIGMGGGGYPGGGGRPGGGQRYPQQTRVDGKKVLQQISQETGGRFFEVSKKDTVESIYAQIQDELRNQYNLGFTPTQQASEAGYHKIQLTTKKKDLTVQTREGYYKD